MNRVSPTQETAISEFIERLGMVTQADGLSRIAGRILGFLIIHGGPFSFSELAQRLQVSRGSISTNTRLLETIGVIERVSMPGDRQDYFQIRNKPYDELLRGSILRLRKAREVVLTAEKDIPDTLDAAHQRLKELREFYEMLIVNTEAIVGKESTQS